MNSRNVFVVAALLAAFIVACKKENPSTAKPDEPPAWNQDTTLFWLTKGGTCTWIVSYLPNNPKCDLVNWLVSCNRNELTLKLADSTFELRSGDYACDTVPPSKLIDHGTWKLSNANRLTLYCTGSNTRLLHINSLSPKGFMVSSYCNSGSDDDIRFFIKQ